MSYPKQWMISARALLKSERGAVLPMIGLGLFTMLIAAGVSVDMGRAQIVQSRLSNALDSAGLAAGSVASTSDISTEVNKYFYVNFPAGYMGTTINTLSVSGSAGNYVITLDVTGSVPTTFMKIFGINSVAVAAHSEITRANKGMELVLVMDTTGSMDQTAGGGVTKISAAKTAATDLVNILYGSQTSIDNLWIGLVPFAQAVNIGSSRTSWVSPGSFNWGTTTWNGCVDSRHTSNRDVTDDPPSVALFPKYYWACHTSYNAWYGTNSSRNNCNTGSGLQYKSGLGTSLGPNKYCSQVITPMTSSKSTILAGINAMQTDGNTHIVLGASWGWRMLSPRWRGLWGGEMDTDDLPQDYNTPLMNKVVVLMTDGDNTISSSVRGAYGYLSNGYLGTTNQSNAETQLDTRLQTVCTSMKNNGILIYTVALGTGISTSSQNMLRNCATKPEYFFNSPTTADLQVAFHMIGDALANLRISK